MLATPLVTMIEKHAEELTRGVVHELQTDPRTPSYHKLDPKENDARVFDVVSHLGEWLDRKSTAATDCAYRKLGQKRFREGVPLAEVRSALMLTMQTLRRYIKNEGWMDSALELCQQIELYDMISRFFDRAIYFTVLSYEEELRSAEKTAAQSEPHKWRLAAMKAPKSATAGWG